MYIKQILITDLVIWLIFYKDRIKTCRIVKLLNIFYYVYIMFMYKNEDY